MKPFQTVGRGGADRGVLGTVVGLSRLCLLTVDCEQQPFNSTHDHCDAARGKVKGVTTKTKWGEKVMSEGAMSCPERREEPRDMTDYRQRQRSRPKPRLQLFVMAAGKGDVGHKEGQTKKAGLGERK